MDSIGGYLKFTNPDGRVEDIPWNLTAPRLTPCSEIAIRRSLTPAEEVWQLVQDYYKENGMRVPLNEAKLCLAAITEEKEEWTRPPPPPQLHISGLPLEMDDPKPSEFGTPAFWAWTRRQRIRINAERAAEGLPPLPTAREKAAQKAEKAAQKEAQKAEKAAQKADKEKKKAEKAVQKTAKSKQ